MEIQISCDNCHFKKIKKEDINDILISKLSLDLVNEIMSYIKFSSKKCECIIYYL